MIGINKKELLRVILITIVLRKSKDLYSNPMKKEISQTVIHELKYIYLVYKNNFYCSLCIC